MTPAQFARAVAVSGLGADTPHVLAARAVLVDNLTQSRAAERFSIDRAAVYRSAKRIAEAAKACPCCGRAF